ncbi:DNA methyltransferase [Rhodococcus qingshengii]|uniref:Eco57I restriction-modification methylase domain-containing protein n=1 Tax=Rhodococcus qingshengii TaxID=334542 RepID=UPI0028F1DEDE|nr:DNA methyltransferase [Rhodococcus qingshengii]MDT9665051.1 DNA methyltransferase [Rhodococcus qingshengii]
MFALDGDRRDILNDGRATFEKAWEAHDIRPADEDTLEAYRTARDEWVRLVLGEVAQWGDDLRWGADAVPNATAFSPTRAISISPSAVLMGQESASALVYVVDPVDHLNQDGTDGWAATAIDRIEAMLRASGIEIGVLTDGRWWALVGAREGAMCASGIVDSQTWSEEQHIRNAFFALLAPQYLIGGDPVERLPKLFEESVAAAEEITEALGAQVRRAVELIVQSFSETAVEARRRGQPNPLPADPHQVYEATVTVMMRVVFLLFAEERGLLPQSELFVGGYGISTELDALRHRTQGGNEDTLESTYLTWHRLLATSQALWQGASFENMRMPAYGGSLFDPDRFPFLTTVNEHKTLALPVSDRVMLRVLESVQIAHLKGGEARHISFRDIDVEQIGYIYEGLLGYSCEVVQGEVKIGLRGTSGEEPEIGLDTLDELRTQHVDPKKLAKAIIDWVKEDQPSSKPQTPAALNKLLQTPLESDGEAVRFINSITEDDPELRTRLTMWVGVMRRDLRGKPMVVRPGELLVIETPSRRNAGAHYTPSFLAEEVVQHALEPLCYSPGPHQTADQSQWVLKSPEEILRLKVADIAAGSGAFLVAAGRYLAKRVVEAWGEDPDGYSRGDLHTQAMRKVVANCLYGADINEMAVEMCKLSLWLVSLDRDLPFSFVDDKVLLGNTLLGITSLDQLRKLHIDPEQAGTWQLGSITDTDIDATIKTASEIRGQLASEIDEFDLARNARAKRRLLTEFNTKTAQLRQIADGIIAAGLREGGKPGKKLNEQYENLRIAVSKAYPMDGRPADPQFLGDVLETGLTPTVVTDYERWKPIHWVLEIPDVMIDHGGFDAIVGNPPFLGGKKLTGAMGTNLREWYINTIALGVKGHADLVAYFFLRGHGLLNSGGALGLIATNSIAQGDTREVGLDQMVDRGFTITRAVQSAPWPAASASLEYAAVWGSQRSLSDELPRSVGGLSVRRISTLLEAEGRVEGLPIRLIRNANLAFIGCYILGMGFIVDPVEASSWIDRDQKNQEILFPYLNGEDINSRSDFSASRWVIDFNALSLESAKKFSFAISRVEKEVYPERQKVNRKALRERWWQYADKRPAMRAAIADLSEVLVLTRHTKTVMPVRVTTGQIFSDALVVFSTDSYATQAILSSTAHYLWVVKYGSTIGMGTRYTPSDVFDTFPQPVETDRLRKSGRVLESERRNIMGRRKLGLTKLYNLVNDPEIEDVMDLDVARLREIHAEIDNAVMESYGWEDLDLDYGFHTYRQIERFTVNPAVRAEILDRLLQLNHERAAAEDKQRTLSESAGTVNAKRGRKPKVDDSQGTMF